MLASHVHELMTDEVITTTPDKDVEEIVSVMLDQHLKNVPVVDKGLPFDWYLVSS